MDYPKGYSTGSGGNTICSNGEKVKVQTELGKTNSSILTATSTDYQGMIALTSSSGKTEV